MTETRSVRVEELGDVLHDAWIDLASVVLAGGRLSMAGVVEGNARLGGSRWLSTCRFGFRLTVDAVTAVDVTDEDDTGLLAVSDVCRTESGFEIRSVIPGRILVTTSAVDVRLVTDPSPTAVRRWFRWHDV